MMKIIYFSQKEQFLAKMTAHAGKIEYVTPSPAKADGLRTRLTSQNSQDVITIAKFTSNLVEHLWAGEEKPQVKRKSELLLIFGILKNKYLPDLGYEQFTQAYNLFSDLRSFTLNEDALTSVLDEQPEIIKQAIKLFWKLLELTGQLDEHGAYQQIGEKLRSSDENPELDKTYVFWGFQHLNGQQVDLLKALAIRYNVIIPFPEALKHKLKRNDWISWLRDSKVEEVDLDQAFDAPVARWFKTNSREIAQSLKDSLQDGDQIILGVSKLSPLHLDIVPSNKVSFKIPYQLLTNELKEVSFELKQFSGSTSELTETLSEKFKTPKSLKHLKVYQLYLEALKEISDMTDEVIKVDRFFLKLLSEVVALNQPRTSFVPVSSDEMTIDLKDMSTLEDIDRTRRVILCIDDRFDDIQSLGQNYTESIQKALSVLGPLKRNELELLFKQWEFKDLFSHADVTVMMSENILKHSLIWKRLFEGIELTTYQREQKVTGKVVRDTLRDHPKKMFEGTFSASKFQSYLDCPRKFYFSYVEKIFPNIIVEKDFDPMTAGTIRHEIIEEFIKRNKTEEEIEALTAEIMQKYIELKKLKLPDQIYQQKLLQFSHQTLNGINFLKQLEEKTGDKIKWLIEEPIKLEGDYTLNGRIDCVGVGEKYLFLLDFKSTEMGASSGKEVSSYESVQLWVYALASQRNMKDLPKKEIVMGYVVLDKPSASILFTSAEELKELSKKPRFCGVHVFKDHYDAKITEAEKVLVTLSAAIRNDKNFGSAPRGTACMFCELNKVCVKSELTHV